MDRVALCIFCALNAAPMDVVTIKIFCIHEYTLCSNSLDFILQLGVIFILLSVRQCCECFLLPAEGDKSNTYTVTVTSVYISPVNYT